MEPKVYVQNVVASARLKHEIDLDAIVKAFPNVEYTPEVFPGLVFKLKRPKSSILIFRNGKMVCTGAKSERDALRAVRKAVKELRKAGIVISGKPEITITNIVATIDLGEVGIDIEKAAYEFREGYMYEPDQFPGAVYRMQEPKVTFLIFSSGKLVCSGAKTEEDVYKAVKKIRNILEEKNLMYKP